MITLKSIEPGKLEGSMPYDNDGIGRHFRITFPLLLIGMAWRAGCSMEGLANGYAYGLFGEDDWIRIRNSGDVAKLKMLERALNFIQSALSSNSAAAATKTNPSAATSTSTASTAPLYLLVTHTKPKFTHACDECRFLGSLTEDSRHYDLYFCEQNRSNQHATVIARFGSDGLEYVSGWPSAHPALQLAHGLAQARALMPL